MHLRLGVRGCIVLRCTSGNISLHAHTVCPSLLWVGERQTHIYCSGSGSEVSTSQTLAAIFLMVVSGAMLSTHAHNHWARSVTVSPLPACILRMLSNRLSLGPAVCTHRPNSTWAQLGEIDREVSHVPFTFSNVNSGQKPYRKGWFKKNKCKQLRDLLPD